MGGRDARHVRTAERRRRDQIKAPSATCRRMLTGRMPEIGGRGPQRPSDYRVGYEHAARGGDAVHCPGSIDQSDVFVESQNVGLGPCKFPRNEPLASRQSPAVTVAANVQRKKSCASSRRPWARRVCSYLGHAQRSRSAPSGAMATGRNEVAGGAPKLRRFKEGVRRLRRMFGGHDRDAADMASDAPIE